MCECWGAQGGDSQHPEDDGQGGKGGYATGTKNLSKSYKLYVCVGQSGNDAGINAPYNGGGKSYYSGLSYMYAQGGGCTHIASTNNRGELANYVNNKSEIVLVAGAGGGFEGSWRSSGGSYGGGLTGGDGADGTNYSNLTVAKGGTQTTGGSAAILDGNKSTLYNPKAGSFGKGGDAFSASGDNPGGAGGGGWYGGGGSPYAYGGGGGSSYVGGVTNGKTIAGNESMPSPTGGTETGHSGNGYCKITWHPAL